MTLDLLDHIRLSGPAFSEPFVRYNLEPELAKRRLLPKTSGAEGDELHSSWESYRHRLRELVMTGGPVRVCNHVLEPLVKRLGYDELAPAPAVQTREGLEEGGLLFTTASGARLRAWAAGFDEDLAAPARRGHAYRFSHLRVAQRVLLASGERIGLLTNGVELRILLCDPARPDSQIEIPIDPVWKRSRTVPDSYRLLLALCSPAGVTALPELVEGARLQQSRVTRELRTQARQAVEGFLQAVLDHPDNEERLAAHPDPDRLARRLWREGLVTVYRLLFILKLEASDDPARALGFASTSLWRNSFSPTVTLARYARQVLDHNLESGCLLEAGLRNLFRLFAEGLHCTELSVKPLGGALFGAHATPLLSDLRWGEHGVAWLLDRLLWTPQRRGADARTRVHYGPLDVEDLGRVYEALLELEPGITAAPMCRLRRAKLEVVVPVAQGERYRPRTPVEDAAPANEDDDTDPIPDEDEDESGGKKTKVEWIEEIPPGRFYLRVGLGRKASGSFYTPHSFVRFLVQETLGPLSAERCPPDAPQPAALLTLKALDNAMGSGHFHVEVVRFLGDRLYEACRLCDERALAAQQRAATAKTAAERAAAEQEAAAWWGRVAQLPDPNDELMSYLPSRAAEGGESGLSEQKALALCKRLIAVHCIYGVDKNPLAVELAKLALWLECHAEGLPLTFLDHRLVVGDSLTGPFFDHLLTYPGNGQPLEGLYSQDLSRQFTARLQTALRHVRDLETTVGVDVADLSAKQTAKARLDSALQPFRLVAAAWAGGVMLGRERCDDLAYKWLVERVAATGDLPATLDNHADLRAMLARGLGVDEAPGDRAALYDLLVSGHCVPALPFDLTFPEVFYPDGDLGNRRGFDTLLGNPPWDRMLPADKEFFAAYDFSILSAPTKRERTATEKRLLQDPTIQRRHEDYIGGFRADERVIERLYQYQVAVIDGKRTIGKQDAFRVFMERNAQLLNSKGVTGVIVPSAFHANEGATGVRRLYLEELALQCCYSFENRNKLFEIDSRFKFALVVAARTGPTIQFRCGFYLQDDKSLFAEESGQELVYTLDFVRQTGSVYLSLVELRSRHDLEVAMLCFSNGKLFGPQCEQLSIRLGREMNVTDDAWRFTPTTDIVTTTCDPRDSDLAAQLRSQGYLILHEGKTFWHFDDHWGPPPRYLVKLRDIKDKRDWLMAARLYRLAFRDIASSTNERTAVFCFLPPGVVSTNKAPSEREPAVRLSANALSVLAMANSYVFDWTVRLKTASTVNLFILNSCPLPRVEPYTGPFHRLLAHLSLRLTCNHAGYAPLWREQLGDTWREPTPPFTWPVLAGDDARWRVRAAIDAVVAQAYGLNRDQYAHVLSTFSHKSYPKAPELCLARFDELTATGLAAFTQKYDPYWDIPLNQNLPQPVIDLPLPEQAEFKGQMKLGI